MNRAIAAFHTRRIDDSRIKVTNTVVTEMVTGLGVSSRATDRAFNDTLVRGGNVPLDVLAGYVDAYVGTASA